MAITGCIDCLCRHPGFSAKSGFVQVLLEAIALVGRQIDGGSE
jgi:hypothetical protein